MTERTEGVTKAAFEIPQEQVCRISSSVSHRPLLVTSLFGLAFSELSPALVSYNL